MSGNFQKVSVKVQNDIVDFLISFSFVAMYNFLLALLVMNLGA